MLKCVIYGYNHINQATDWTFWMHIIKYTTSQSIRLILIYATNYTRIKRCFLAWKTRNSAMASQFRSKIINTNLANHNTRGGICKTIKTAVNTDEYRNNNRKHQSQIDEKQKINII